MSKEFFQGWYLKCSNESTTVAFIIALHHDGKEQKASIQMITEEKAYFLPFPSISFDRLNNVIRIGNNAFSLSGASLNIQTPEVSASGFLRFSNRQKLAGDIMGPFRYVPFMQCRHKVYSMNHLVTGELEINKKTYQFSNHPGYIEGDRGTSFPKEYAWTQCHFPKGSLMLSVAHIPMGVFHFTGVIGFVLLNGREYRIATYLGAKIKHIGSHIIWIEQGGYHFIAKLINPNSHSLYAPQKGNMSRFIRESPVCSAQYQFVYQGKTLLNFQSHMASFEYEFNR